MRTIQSEEKIKILYTYIPGLDDHLNGDIPLGSIIYVKGAPATGKTVFTCQMATESAKRGYKSIIVTLDMREKEVLAIIKSFKTDNKTIDEHSKKI